VSNPVRSPATYQDVLDAPSEQVAELISGELHLSPRPGWPHATATSVLGMDLGGAFLRGRGGPGGWWIVFEPELHLGEDVVVPDLAGWRQDRMPSPPREAFTTLAPDWCCEVVSPGTARRDRGLKVPIYARAGVSHVWLVEPLAQTLEVLRLADESYLLAATFGGSDRVRAEPFEAIELELGALWPQGTDESQGEASKG
jgi:Uma2 family endonuclease